jgi:hypothetical protein
VEVGLLSIIFTLVSAIAWAQQDQCPVLKESDLSIRAVQGLIQNKTCNIRTITDVLNRLPESYRAEYSAFYRSRSLQGPNGTNDYKNPRVILGGASYSKDGPKLIMTFNGDPNQAGNLALEMVEINTKGGKDDPDVFVYAEASFPYHENDIGTKSWDETQKKITFNSHNPERCKKCHGEPARPIFPGYPDWEGSFGSSHGAEPSAEEIAGTKVFMDKYASPEASRYKSLGKFSTSDPREQASRFDDHNQALNGKLGDANAIRVARLVLKTPDYDKFRYAAIGSFLGCDDLESFLPRKLSSGLLENIENKFALKKKWPEDKQNEWINQVYNSNHTFLISDLGKTADKKNTFPVFKKKFLSDLGGSPEFKNLKLDTFAIQGVSRADPMGASLRLIMEGRGINIGNWFLDLTQPTYRYHNGGSPGDTTVREMIKADPGIDQTFADAFINMPTPQNKEEKIKIRGNLCNKARDLSLKSLNGVKISKLAASKEVSPTGLAASQAPLECKVEPDVSHQVRDLKSIVERCDADKFPNTFSNTCATCHDSPNKIAPSIPFSSPEKMSKWLSEDRNKKLIKGKLLNPDETLRMPPTRKLSQEELNQILNYIGTK